VSDRLHWKSRPPRLNGPAAARTARAIRAPRDVTPIPHDTRVFVWSRDGGRCRNCGSDQELHFDHVIPRALGGSNLAENIEVLCRTCNLKKGSKLLPPAPGTRREGANDPLPTAHA
jgi:5-methylcytosine-specific restriction endonuclease McrA